MNMQQSQSRFDSGESALRSLIIAASMLGVPAEYAQLRRGYVIEDDAQAKTTLVRIAKDLNLRAKWRQYDVRQESLEAIASFPVLAVLEGERHVVLLNYSEGQVVLVDALLQDAPFRVADAEFTARWTGKVLLVARQVPLPSKKERFGFSWFFPSLSKYKKLLVQVLAASLALQLFGLLTPYFTQIIIDRVLVHRSANALNIILLGMLGAGLFQAVMTAFRSYLFTNTTSKINVTLSEQIFRHVASLPLKYFEKWQVGDIVSRMRELDTIRQFVTGSALTLVLDVVFAVVYLIVMLFYSGVLSVVTLVTVGAYILLNLVVAPVFRVRLNRKFLTGADTQSFLIETVTGIQTLKSMAVERKFVERYEGLLSRYAKTSFAANFLGIIASNIGLLIQLLFTTAVLWIGARIVMEGQLTVGELIAFQMLAGQVIAPILRLVNMWQQFQQTRVSVERLSDIMDETAEPAFDPNRTTLPKLAGEISFENVTFRYRDEGNEALRNVCFHIKAGQTIGVVGPSGSGKSTLTKLIQRLYVPAAGRVMIDGVDLAQVQPAWLRRQIGVVLQDNYLFNGSIAENIMITKPDATEQEMFQAAQLAGVLEFVKDFPNGFNTSVGERGSLLSGGQRQRIAIARALINDPSVLIFDEATSALDYESERIILDNLEQIAQNRTLILIAHRLSTIQHAHRILVIERGQLVQQGTHDELVIEGGTYQRLYCEQN